MTDSTLEPIEGEQTIPSVVQAKPKADNSKLFIVGGIGVVLISILGSAGYFMFRSHAAPEAAPPTNEQVGAAQPIGLQMPEGAAGAQAPAGSASGVPVPSIQDGNGYAQAIELAPTAAGAPGSMSGGAARPAAGLVDDAPIFPSDSAPELGRVANARSASDPDQAQAGSGGSPGASGSAGRSGSRSSATAEARASLAAYKTQLSGMMNTLQQRINGATGTRTTASNATPQSTSAGGSASGGALFGSMSSTATAAVQARMLGDMHLTLPKGSLFLCSLKTRVITATSGFVGCQTTRDVLSASGKVVLVERGSHLDGEYRIVQVAPGVTRIPVLWTRLRTPHGVLVDLDSPATGELGESGLGGYVDNRWGERLSAALLLSLIQDAVQYAADKQSDTSSSQGADGQIVLTNTTSQGNKMAEMVLSTTINIPPLLYQNQGGLVGVYTARDLDFSSVYELRPTVASPNHAALSTPSGEGGQP
ncbi:type IV secretion system protein VirB10 [Ideonella sp. DXS29W]|uniref:Type IV secretion system protein VirB10 n=1 Tax=Ideonella lacteola TaxID=2984193 RepID=A0ABU9BXV5_9BURK